MSTAPDPGGAPAGDRTARRAALWATLVAVPVTLAVAVLLISRVTADGGQASPSASSAPAPVPTAPVAMPAPKLPARVAGLCRTLVSRLPAAVRDLPRRPVTAGKTQNAAYGEPAITVACGVPPAAVAPEAFLLTTDTVCWHTAHEPTGTVWTTVDRDVPVRVTVPARYEQQAQWVNEFSAAITATLPPRTAAVPTGCG